MTVRSERAHGLGRGLSTLIPQRTAGQPGPTEIALDRIRPNPHQPRRRFDEAELATLTESVRVHGILQPILVTETIDGYRLVAGERRLRAAAAAGLERIPAVIRQLDPAYPVDAIATKRPRTATGEVTGADMGRTVLDVLRRAGGPLTIAQVAERVVALRGLDAASGAVRAAVEGSAGRALRHQRDKGAVRNVSKQGRSALWELAS